MRVAFFPDSFHEVNGVAHTARNFQAYAARHGLPFLRVCAAPPSAHGAQFCQDGTISTLDLPRSRAAIRMEKDLSFDPFFFRHAARVGRALRTFRPDVIHMTGPSELGMLAAWFAWRMGVPLAAGWHTNVHEYAARRAAWLPPVGRRWVEAATLSATARFYRLARVLFAPNEALCDLLRQRTRRPCHVMRRGVDTALFTPARRTRAEKDGTLVLGYVGRLSVEKNVSMLAKVEDAAESTGLQNACFLIVGQGEQEVALRKSLRNAYFMGVQRGEVLAGSYADMDLFVFPSETDTFGNVVLEALASGVPAAVTTGGGPRYIVQDGTTGIVRESTALPAAICDLLRDTQRLDDMRTAARAYALGCGWDAIFDGVYDGYRDLDLAEPPTAG